MNDETKPEAPPPKFDFPSWLPPMLVKELRQGLRQRGFVGGMIGVQAILLIVFVTGFVSETGDGSSRAMIDGFFWSMTGFVLLVSAPLRAMTGLSSELETRTMDLLLLTRLDAWRIVWGKWVSLITQTVLMAVTLLPYAVVRYFFGSVDLVADFAILAALLLGGAVLTGVGLWASGLPKPLRILMTVASVFALFSSMNGVMMAMRYGSHVGFTGFGAGGPDAWLGWVLSIWGGAVVLIYSLSLAVRWFAPPAENHAIWPRFVPLAFALPAPFLAWAGREQLAAMQAAVALAALAVVAAIELASTRDVMAIHLRGWMTRARWRRKAGPFLLPGWPSACGWLAVMLVVAGAAVAVIDAALVAQDLPLMKIWWLGVLGWTGLVFPILLVSLIPTAGRVSGVVYFALHGLLGLFAVMAGSNGLSRMAPTSMRVLDWISHAVPTTSFWHAVMEFNKPSEVIAVEFGQAVGVALTLTMMLYLARPYWERVRFLRSQVARAEGEARA